MDLGDKNDKKGIILGKTQKVSKNTTYKSDYRYATGW